MVREIVGLKGKYRTLLRGFYDVETLETLRDGLNGRKYQVLMRL